MLRYKRNLPGRTNDLRQCAILDQIMTFHVVSPEYRCSVGSYASLWLLVVPHDRGLRDLLGDIRIMGVSVRHCPRKSRDIFAKPCAAEICISGICSTLECTQHGGGLHARSGGQSAWRELRLRLKVFQLGRDDILDLKLRASTERTYAYGVLKTRSRGARDNDRTDSGKLETSATLPRTNTSHPTIAHNLVDTSCVSSGHPSETTRLEAS